MTYQDKSELLKFQQKFCTQCSNIRCSGAFDEAYRDGCLHFQNAEKKSRDELRAHIKQLEEEIRNLRTLH